MCEVLRSTAEKMRGVYNCGSVGPKFYRTIGQN